MVSGTRFLASLWSEWSEEIVCRARFRDLALAGLLSLRVAERCEVRVREALRFRTSPCLYHGDILGNWSNVLVDIHGRVCSLLDWEFGGSGAALEQEIASVLYCFHRDGTPLAEREVYLQAILRGFNVSPVEYLESLRARVNAFVILHAAKAINRLFPHPEAPVLIGQERENRLRFARRARSLMEQLAFE